MEREHTEIQVHPVFIQVVDKAGRLMDKSPNLKELALNFEVEKRYNEQFNALLNGREIRQVQIPIEENGHIAGYILAAMSMEDAKMVVHNLRQVLWILFPVVLLGLFIVSRMLAGQSIRPIQLITATTDRITRNSLDERIGLPKNRDELYTLTASINELLQRMQDALEREKQFTSDASHELRTPLSVLQGTLEVLLRKPRTEAEYREKIAYSMGEIRRMSKMVDQLLMLARFDEGRRPANLHVVTLLPALDDVLQRHKTEIQEKALSVDITGTDTMEVIADRFDLDLILDNLLSNAIKYGRPGSRITIAMQQQEGRAVCTIQDEGIGIRAEDMPSIFNPFFRSEALAHKQIGGNGLGLSIVKKACARLGIEVTVQSVQAEGTCARLAFPVAPSPP
jgi:signal transduction histidine kinase